MVLALEIWRKQNENIDPSCLVTTVKAGGGGVMVWGMFSWHTLGPLVPIGHRLNATAYLSIVSDHMSLFYCHKCLFIVVCITVANKHTFYILIKFYIYKKEKKNVY
uniref:Uncharacterized protein n=1 Tax=Cyprinus carpio carpio TaxID=630221 RepID=A0A9J7ZI12_CYPCA